MIEAKDLESRLRQLEDRAAIHDLVHLYGFMCDERLESEFRDAFTEDGILRVQNGLIDAVGHEQIIAAMRKRWAPLGVSNHVVHGIVVSFDESDPDTASGLVSSHVESVIGGVAQVVAIRYRDVYRHDRGRWRFAERELSYLYFMPVEAYASGALAQPGRVRTTQDPQDFDWPEVLVTGATPPWIGRFFETTRGAS